MIDIKYLLLGLVLAASFGCSKNSSGGIDSGTTDTDTDTDVDTDTDTDSDSDTDPTSGPNMCPGEVQSFIWIANTTESTLSKVCTINAQEVARYRTCPTSPCDPSRTSVNLHGDMVVSNRYPTTGPSSVTKFIANYWECTMDWNGNGQIDTSTGPTEVLPWGEDDCMAWNTELSLSGMAVGVRATAWDGEEDPETGLGGSVWIGATYNKTIYKLNGETGLVEGGMVTALAHYGGVMDGLGNFWTVRMNCTASTCDVERINMTTLETQVFPVHCGYGITADAQGRIWTSGSDCVNRLDPASGINDWLQVDGSNRGIAVDGEGSVWSANTAGDLVRVSEADVTLIDRFPVGGSNMIGVAIDYEGYVWTVSEDISSAHKIDPVDYTITDVPIGLGPYTYSDMTGMQLLNVTPIE